MNPQSPTSNKMMADKIYDKRGIPIERGDIVKVFHFIGARRKKHYMYKQCMGICENNPKYMEFSHLDFEGETYPELIGQTLTGYEIVQSIDCLHEDRPRKKEAHQ